MTNFPARDRADRRPVLSPLALNLAVATYLLALCNSTFWRHLVRIFEGRDLTAMVFAGAVWALMLLVVALIAVRRAQKPVLIMLLLIAALTSYYVDKLGVVVDREMIQNAMATTFDESKHLVTRALAVHVLLLGVMPSTLVLWVKVPRRGILGGLGVWALVTSAAAALVVGLLFTNLKAYSTVLRGNKELMASVQPLAPLSGALRFARMLLSSTQITVEPTGSDAGPGTFLAAADKPVLFVIVAGETARAANWSLDGYGRDTNPELSARQILYYSNATSCGTATATSLPCMFSPLTREEYSYEGGLGHENLLDVLSHAGFQVEWWDNNGGHKNLADRVTSRVMTAANGPEFCQPECVDAIFEEQLARKAATLTTNTVIVLHQIGSHGPSYWLRYPPEHERFAPACQSEQLTDCSIEEIVNAYDNTIAYTDHVLARLIDHLESQGRVIPALFYMSDHGESLGEAGIYLHGTPYFMAPAYQTEVPMVIWMSERFRDTLGLDRTCLAEGTKDSVSHDNMFSTILGLLDVSTEAREPDLDLAGRCRKMAS